MANFYVSGYNHSKKAGNRGDVWKHFILTVLAENIVLDSDSIHYVDCQAGAPIHNLLEGGEWQRGINPLIDKGTNDNAYVGVVKRYWPKRYPSGWLVVANIFAKRFKRVKISLFDTSMEVARHYCDENLRNLTKQGYVPENVGVKFCKDDGFTGAINKSNIDLIFLDPPFHPNAQRDWNSLEKTCIELKDRGQSFAAWYPFFWHTRPRDLLERTECEAWQVLWSDCGPKPSQHLKGCGVLLSDDLATIVKKRE